MSEDFEAPKDDLENEIPEGSEGHSDYKPADTKDVKARERHSAQDERSLRVYPTTVGLPVVPDEA